MPARHTRRIGYLALLGLGLSLLLMGCGATLTQATGKLRDSYRAHRSYDDGLRRYTARDYTGAIPLLERALVLQPAFDDAEAYLAWSHYHTGKYAEATRHFRQAIVRQPKWEGLYNGLGWSRYRVGRYHIALEAFEQALALDPQYRDARVGLAFSLFELGRYVDARPHLARLTPEGEGSALQRPAPDLDQVRSRYAWTLYYLGDHAQARLQFTKGLAARPDWYGLHNGLGWTSLRLGDAAGARVHFQRALQLKPDFADAMEGLALSGS